MKFLWAQKKARMSSKWLNFEALSDLGVIVDRKRRESYF